MVTFVTEIIIVMKRWTSSVRQYQVRILSIDFVNDVLFQIMKGTCNCPAWSNDYTCDCSPNWFYDGLQCGMFIFKFDVWLLFSSSSSSSVQRKSINGTCPGSYACDINTPLVCFYGLCSWLVLFVSFLSLNIHKTYVFFSFLVLHQQHGLVRIVHAHLVNRGMVLHVKQLRLHKCKLFLFFFVLLTEFLYFAARLLRDKYTNGFFLKQEKRNKLLPVIKKRKKSKIWWFVVSFFFLSFIPLRG